MHFRHLELILGQLLVKNVETLEQKCLLIGLHLLVLHAGQTGVLLSVVLPAIDCS